MKLIILLMIINGILSKRASKIVTGVVAYEGRHPYQVSVRKNNKHICGGSILDSNHVLTAAQCVTNEEGKLPFDLSNFSVLSGTNKIEPFIPILHQVEKAYMPKSFNTKDVYINDISILTLAREIPMDKYRQPIGLPKIDVPENSSVTLSGWGVLKDVEKTTVFDRPEYLRTLVTTVISNEDCKNFHHRPIYPQHLCTLKGRGYGFCSGDAGGPLVWNNTIVGVASWTTSCARGMPDVYTRIHSFMPWIEKLLKTPQ